MSLWRLFKDKKTPEEIAAIREARKIYNAGIKSWTDVIIKFTKSNFLTPETAADMSKLLMTDKQWLKDNPNAEIEDIVTKYDNLAVNLTTLQDNDKIRIYFLNYLKLAENNTKLAQQTNQITRIQYDNITELIKTKNDWYTKNKATASEIDYNTELQDFNEKILDIGLNPDQVKDIQDSSEKSQKEVKDKILEDKKQIEKIDNSSISFGKASTIVSSNAFNTVYNYLFLVLRILAGCLAANMAIGRLPIYRLLYFVYGMVPFFTYFVLLYTLYRRIRFGPIPIYAILPLSLEPATTRLGRYLWYPFYWIPDQESMNAYGEFQHGLHSMVLGLSGVVMVSAAAGAAGAAVMKGGALSLAGAAVASQTPVEEVRKAGLRKNGVLATGAVPSPAGTPGIVTAVGSALNTAKRIGSSAANAVRAGVGVATSTAGAAGGILGNIGSMGSDFSDDAGNISTKTAAMIGDKNLTAAVKEIGDATGKTFQAGVSAGKSITTGAVAVGSTAAKTYNAVSATTKQVAEGAIGVAATKAIKNTASKVVTTAGEMASDALEAVTPPLPF